MYVTAVRTHARSRVHEWVAAVDAHVAMSLDSPRFHAPSTERSPKKSLSFSLVMICRLTSVVAPKLFRPTLSSADEVVRLSWRPLLLLPTCPTHTVHSHTNVSVRRECTIAVESVCTVLSPGSPR
jgi:hypothetical protein